MPSWKVHKKWGKRLGIKEKTLDVVNKLIDSPKSVPDFRNFCEKDKSASIYSKGKPTKIDASLFDSHDVSRSNKAMRKLKEKYLRKKGKDFLKAFYLHHILDYLEFWTDVLLKGERELGEILSEEKIKEKIATEINTSLLEVKNFVIDNSKELTKDLEKAGEKSIT